MFPVNPVLEQSDRSLRIRAVPATEVVLQDFILRREDGVEDGHIGQLGISQQGPIASGGVSYLVAFADDDGDEAGRAQFRWIDLGSLGSAASTTKIGDDGIRDSTTIGWGPSPENRVPLLGGFLFMREGGGEHHLREIAVLPGGGGYAVTFRDDSPGDDRYRASVDIAWVPERNVVSRHNRRFEDAVGSVDVPRERGQAALCGFSFKYKDSDHHIRHLEVRLSGDRIRLAMRDNDRNRRFEATVEYALLQD